jgi:hypothetical protein
MAMAPITRKLFIKVDSWSMNPPTAPGSDEITEEKLPKK